MLLLVTVPERSTARKTCPAIPSGFIDPPKIMRPPRLTVVTWSKVGVTPPFCALDERTHQIWPVVRFTAPIKRLPLLSTSSVPHWGELGIKIGLIQVTPPSVDRLNAPPSQGGGLFVRVQNWYWKPCPMPLVLSMVNHSLSPPVAPRSPESSIHDWPPFSASQTSVQKNW